MNLKSIIGGFAAAALLTACSNEPGNPDNGGNESFDGSGYIAVGINLPTTTGARGVNDDFTHGEEQEYKVNNAMLLVFTGSSEANAVFHSAYDLTMTPGGVEGDEGANITSSYLKTVHLNDVEDNDDLWGLVMVNYDHVVTNKVLTQGGEGHIASMNIGGKAYAKGTAYSQLASLIVNSDLCAQGNFFMTNSPVATVPGGATAPAGAQVQTLVHFGMGSSVCKPTEEEAKAYPAGSFFVERAVAKATLTYTANTVENLKDLTIASVEWVLDNTEATSYIVRNMGTDLGYLQYNTNVQPLAKGFRFVGDTKIGTTALQPAVDLYRTYWAIDPAYNTNKAANKDYLTNAFKGTGSDKPQYCHENTFNVANQSYRNTTRALLKVTYTAPQGAQSNGNLYTVNNLEDVIYYNDADAKSFSIRSIVESRVIRDAIKAAVADGQSFTLTTANVADYLNIEYVQDATTNLITVSAVTFKADAFTAPVFKAVPVADASALATMIANTNATFAIVEYKGGVCYYDIRFKHFGDELAPWNDSAVNETTLTTSQAYPNLDENNFLGRFGMVRNNWYEININSFKKLGKPVVGQLDVDNDDTPDDNKTVEKWISFKVNILAWAKRVQQEDI